MADRLDPTFVRAQIEALRVTHPQIWDAEDEALLADMLEGTTDLNEFLTLVVHRMLEAKAFIHGIDLLISEQQARCARIAQRSDAMRALAFRVMNWAEVRKVELPAATLSIRAGVPRVILSPDAADVLPDHLVRIKREPDRVAIKEQLMRGERMAGAELSNSEPTLAVRVK